MVYIPKSVNQQKIISSLILILSLINYIQLTTKLLYDFPTEEVTSQNRSTVQPFLI